MHQPTRAVATTSATSNVVKLGPSTVEHRADLETFYRRYRRWLGAILRQRLGHYASEADDLVQETYVRAARYDPAEAARNPRALLKQIAVNLARDHMRRNVVRGGLALPIDDIESGRWDTRLSVHPDQESALQLKQILLSLPARDRDVFLLSRFTGMTNAQIASHLDVSIKTVEWRMSKALAVCAKHMRDEEPTP
jgi:RNA polymerase sigma factor (sigma-70 family)